MSFRDNIAREVKELAKQALGATFWLKTTVYSQGLSATAMDLTVASERGDLLVDDVIIRGHTGGGLSSGGTFRIICTNNYGSSVVFAARIADLGTSMNVDMNAARNLMPSEGANPGNQRHSRPTILEEGKKLQVQNESDHADTSAGGDGYVDIRIKFSRMDDKANVNLA